MKLTRINTAQTVASGKLKFHPYLANEIIFHNLIPMKVKRFFSFKNNTPF